jgi:starch-binding outer membrane protein, SusD/RagB family
MSRSYILLIPLFLLLGACEKILDQEPLSQLTVENFYRSETEALAAVSAVYEILSTNDQYKAFGAVALALMEDHCYKATGASDGPGMSEINEFRLFPNNQYITGWYSSCYIGINRANTAIERIGNSAIREDAKKRLVAEAKFMRGLCYFHLVRLFGEVPLILQAASKPESGGIAKSTEAEIWAQVEKDFAEAIPALPLKVPAGEYGRAPKGAAQTFLAQALIWQKKYAAARPLLEEVINSKTYSLVANFVDNYLEAKESGAEIVFPVTFKDLGSGQFSGTNKNSFFIRYIGVRGTGNAINAAGRQAGFGWLLATNKLLANYEMGDKRRDVTFWEENKVSPATAKPFKATATGANGRNATDVGPMKWWWNVQGYDGTSGIDIPLIRYPDVLLLHAESVNEIEGPVAAAYASVNTVRKRAGLADLKAGLSKADFFGAVMKERHVEFQFEFGRWWDLARTQTAEAVFKNDPNKTNFNTAKNYKWPLPQSALDRNPALVQNRNYE